MILLDIKIVRALLSTAGTDIRNTITEKCFSAADRDVLALLHSRRFLEKFKLFLFIFDLRPQVLCVDLAFWHEECWRGIKNGIFYLLVDYQK